MPVITKSALLMVPVNVAYDVVIDVASYPLFLPACQETQIISQSPDGLTASVTVGGTLAGQTFDETFVTHNLHNPNERVTMQLHEGPFEYLSGSWQLTGFGEVGCKVEVSIDYAPRGLLARLLAKFAEPMANKMVDAFSQRIELVYLQHQDNPQP